MKELLIFQFRFRKKAWIFSILIGTLMLTPFLLLKENHNIFLLIMIPLYGNMVGKFFNSKAEKEFMPSIALPLNKRSFVAYLLARNIIFYCAISIFSIATLLCLRIFLRQTTIAWASIPFLLLFFTVIQSLTLVVDSLTSMRKGSFVYLLAMLLSYPSMDIFSSYFSKGVPKGIGILLKGMSDVMMKIISWVANTQYQAILLSIIVGTLSSIFVLAYAKRIRFDS